MQKTFNLLEKKISEILKTSDPFELISTGAPEDEYNLEVPQIAELVTNDIQTDELAKKIRDFYLKIQLEEVVGSIEKYKMISKEILK